MDNVPMKKQMRLISTPEEEEVDRLELMIANESKSFAQLPETSRRFLILYLKRGSGTTVQEIADRCGISKTKAYDLLKDPQLMDHSAVAAQAISTETDIRGSIAIDRLVEDAHDAILKGHLKLNDLSPTAAKILMRCKDRLGLSPQVLKAVRKRSIGPDGRVEQTDSVEVSGRNAEQAISKLAEQRRETLETDFEGDEAE